MKKFITIVLCGVMFVLMVACGGSGTDTTEQTDISTTSVAAWGRVIIEDLYPSCKLPFESFTVIGDAGQRRKIEGRVSVDGVSAYQKFVMIVEFDETFEYPTLISLDVGSTRVYSK